MIGGSDAQNMNKKGASSVLIILIMVVLVVFGLAALTTSMSVLRLTQKTGEWTEEYYNLEGEAEKFIFEVDRILLEAEMDAIRYIEFDGHLDYKNALLPAEIQESVYENYNYYLPPTARGGYLAKVLKAVFYQSAIEKLSNQYPSANIKYPGNFLRQILEDEDFTEITIETTMDENYDEYAKHLDIKIKLIPPNYVINIESGITFGMRLKASFKRYEIVRWKEWQKFFDYSGGIEFTNPGSN